MRQLTILLAASTLALTITSVYLYLQLSAARAGTGAPRDEHRELRNEVARLERVQSGLETDLRAARSAQAAPLAAAPSTGAPPRAADPSSPSLPRTRELSSEQQRVMQRYQFRHMFRELSLSEAEIEGALQVLGQQMERARQPITKEAASPASLASELQRDEAELSAVLGPKKAEQLMALKKLMPIKSELSHMRMRLDEGGEPLSAEQQKKLLELLSSKERPATPRRIQGEDPQQASARLQTWMRDRERERREITAPVLTSKQRELLEEEAAYMEAMRPSFVMPAPAAQPAQAGAPAGPKIGSW